MINKDHLSRTISSVDEIGQPKRNLLAIFLHYYYRIDSNCYICYQFDSESMKHSHETRKKYLKSICTISLTQLL